MPADTIFPIKHIEAGALDVAYEEHGPTEGEPVILLHGFPYDPRYYDRMAPVFASEG